MVLVTVLNLRYFKYTNRLVGRFDDYRLDLDVYGAEYRSPEDAISFLTRWARTLRYDYIFLHDRELSAFGYMLAELAREKVYIDKIPEDGYRREEKVIPLFYDVGSPVRHIYRVTAADNVVRIEGYGVAALEYIRINLEFYSTLETEIPPEYEEVARTGGVIHTIPHPAADRKTKYLVYKIIDLAKSHAKRRTT